MPDVPLIPPGDPTAKTQTIAVAEKIIADVSTGIYRTAAAALKELVTNAYDADATHVQISTGVPHFESLVVRDDGTGMTIERFLEIMKHIGGSWKRLGTENALSEKYKRPLIGRIGIGLLAVAQLGQRFYVSSKVAGSTTRFLAEVDLEAFHKNDAAMRTMVTDDEKVEIGQIRYIDGVEDHKAAHYTVITVPSPKKGLVTEMNSQIRKALDSPATFTLEHRAQSFTDLVAAVQSNRRADVALDGYHLLLWELGLLSPVRYLDGGPFDNSARQIEDVGKLSIAEPDNFSVSVDSMDIRRPIRFPNPKALNYPGPDPVLYPLKLQRKVAGRPLRVEGYIYAQKPHLWPGELQGVQIRLRGVGIGGYDRTWMGYPFDEGLKFHQLTGELHVIDGLESALNIDRASFRETDPHYLTIRAWLWELLKTKIFPDIKQRQEVIRKSRIAAEKKDDIKSLLETLSDAPTEVGLTPRIAPLAPRGRKGTRPVIDIVDGEVVLDKEAYSKLDAEFGLPPAARDRMLRVCVCLAAYGVWERLTETEATGLLRSLGAASR